MDWVYIQNTTYHLSVTSLCSYPKVAPEVKSSILSKHANNWGFCATNSRSARHFFVYLFCVMYHVKNLTSSIHLEYFCRKDCLLLRLWRIFFNWGTVSEIFNKCLNHGLILLSLEMLYATANILNPLPNNFEQRPESMNHNNLWCMFMF